LTLSAKVSPVRVITSVLAWGREIQMRKRRRRRIEERERERKRESARSIVGCADSPPPRRRFSSQFYVKLGQLVIE
jgi:hypothetical protein